MRIRYRLIVAGMLAAGAALVAYGLYIPAKAALAQVLLERAWERVQAGQRDAKPWPWADISPLAVLEVPRLGERSILLEGTSGEAMAFGPGHMINTPPIGALGTAVVAAHRDTQFRYLRDITEGDRIVAQTADGRLSAYRVVEIRVVRADVSGIDPADGGPTGSRLALVTCYPFNGVLHSRWRYVVLADREGAEASAANRKATHVGS
jgi:sortase A